ncbi:MAG: nucleotidyltransferase domain-containing protein [Deltaproteobacteria bacterium]|nr:nucleotidyltransferase domain-containing protein [Deltaproteobacteria bacterium]
MIVNTDYLAPILRRFAEGACRQRWVVRIYLYGSYPGGNPNEWSDIDIAVVSPDFTNRPAANVVRWALPEGTRPPATIKARSAGVGGGPLLITAARRHTARCCACRGPTRWCAGTGTPRLRCRRKCD